MRLTDLQPRWFTFMAHPADGVVLIAGLTFVCPHCMKQRIGVRFKPLIDPAGIVAQYGIVWPCGDEPVWNRQGDTFETLTLSPSINAQSQRIDVPGHWHGFIENGEVR